MCNLIQQKYGSRPTLDKIRTVWMSLDRDRSGYITRQEFSTRAKREIERILAQNQPGQPGYGQPGYGITIIIVFIFVFIFVLCTLFF